ncbi:MAG TPA: hypothetical protein VFC79_11270, partial [Tissierellaceae bacterium]|nr:hypothetical protein [Tissierellaceae bacterium]
ISNVEAFGLVKSAYVSGYPMKVDADEEEVYTKAFDRMGKLASCKSGSGHDNALKGIIVQFDITYPQYFSMQLQRYGHIDIVSSQSKMHRITKMDIRSSCNKYVTDEVIELIESYKYDYISIPTYENFMKLVSNLPMGFELTIGISTNYLQLKTIYNQRKNHKLKEDWGEFCKMIETLPYSEWITGRQ